MNQKFTETNSQNYITIIFSPQQFFLDVVIKYDSQLYNLQGSAGSFQRSTPFFSSVPTYQLSAKSKPNYQVDLLGKLVCSFENS